MVKSELLKLIKQSITENHKGYRTYKDRYRNKCELISLSIEHDTNKIGYLEGSIITYDEQNQFYFLGNCLYINMLYVEKEHRGNGFGSATLDKICDYIIKEYNISINSICLAAIPQEMIEGKIKELLGNMNLVNKLLKFYEKNGFVVIYNFNMMKKIQSVRS